MYGHNAGQPVSFLYVTRYGKRDHSLSNDNAEKMAKIHGQVGIYGIGNESSMGKYNHLPTVWQKQGLSATFVEGAVASLPPLLPRAVNRARTFHGKIQGQFDSRAPPSTRIRRLASKPEVDL